MFIGYDFLNLSNGAVFEDQIPITGITKIELFQGLIDDIYIDEDIAYPVTITKPSTWQYSTVLHAEFNETMEAGSVAAGGYTIDKIKLQKRQWNELEWSEVGELIYNPDDKLLYELYDTNVANDFVYQYSLIPMAAGVIGNRVTSTEITADFEGVFISDKDNNYHLLYDATVGDMAHFTPSAKLEPLGSKYPIVIYSNTDYTEWDVEATFISAHTIAEQQNRQVNIRMEQADRQQLLAFLKNKKPKIYRDIHGNLKLVTVINNPVESFKPEAEGIATLSLTLVEIGATDDETLKRYNLLAGEFE
mgnify:CR=1 FL=1